MPWATAALVEREEPRFELVEYRGESSQYVKDS
jgi:hypothetical protein